jgi:hypothetical protein
MTTSAFRSLNASQLKAAVDIKLKIDLLEAQLDRILSGSPAPAPAPAAGVRRLSPKGRAAIAAAVRRRWAKQKSAKSQKPAKAPKAAAARPKRKLSAEGRAAIVAAAKARWARQKAAAAPSAPVASPEVSEIAPTPAS